MRAKLLLSRPITDEEILDVSRENPCWQFERDSGGALIVSPPIGSDSDTRNVELTFQIATYAKAYGGQPFGSSGGFTMPDKAMYSPDGAWIATERWRALTPKQRASFAPIVPDVWIELRSQSDTNAELRAKLQSIRAFGASYVVLIDPYARTMWTDGTPPPNFVLDLDAICDA